MATLFDYLETQTASFDEVPFNVLDAAVLSQACMVRMDGIVQAAPAGLGAALSWLAARLRRVLRRPTRFSDLVRAEGLDERFLGLAPDDIRRCLFSLAASPRFCDVEICAYEDVFDEGDPVQFAAVAFTWRHRFSCIAFRGTDASLAGWRENLDMTYLDCVPAQRLARDYAEKVAPLLPGALHMVGHSKGGNLALYAALTCSGRVCSHVDSIWCFDAPGFKRGLFGAQDYGRLAGRARRVVPQDPIVGMLMECPIDPQVAVSGAQGVAQHNVFSWEVAGNGFAYRERVNDASRFIHEASCEWLAGMDAERTRSVVDALSAAVLASGARSARDVFGAGADALRGLRDVARRLDPAQRDVLLSALGELANIVVRRFGHDALRFLPWVS